MTDYNYGQHDQNCDDDIDLSRYDEPGDEKYEPRTKSKFDLVPEGKYQARIDRAELVKSKAGNPVMKLDLVIITDSQKGRHAFAQNVLTEKPESKQWLLDTLAICGVRLPGNKIGLLKDALSDLLDRIVEITVKHKRDDNDELRANTYINKFISRGEPGTSYGNTTSGGPAMSGNGVPAGNAPAPGYSSHPAAAPAGPPPGGSAADLF